jgi:anti-sigma B factor antagonist
VAIEHQDVSETFRRISLTGRLDIPGTDEIAMKFTALSATTPRRVVVDLTGVHFLASIGIRALISNAKALKKRGGRMVLFIGDNAAVRKTLEATGIDAILPMFADASEADKAALA